MKHSLHSALFGCVLATLTVNCRSASSFKIVTPRGLESFDLFLEDLGGTLLPAILPRFAEDWPCRRWSLEDLSRVLGAAESWPRDLRARPHSLGERGVPSSVAQFLATPRMDVVVYEVNFCAVIRAMHGAYKVPAAFLQSFYTSPFVGLSHKNGAIAFQRIDGNNVASFWVVQVYGKSRWLLRPHEAKLESVWPWDDIETNTSSGSIVLDVIMHEGDALFVPPRYLHAWRGESEINLLFGFIGAGSRHPEALSMMSAMAMITGGDVEGLSKEFRTSNYILTSHAMHSGHLPILKRLHLLGASFDEDVPGGSTLLHISAASGQADAISFALKQNADPMVRRSNDGFYALHVAAASGHRDAISAFVDRPTKKIKKGILDMKDAQGRQPLHIAASFGHVAALERLLSLRADVHARDRFGFQPLHWAAESNRTSVLSGLLDARAEVLAKNRDGETPLHRAAATGHSTLVASLLNLRADVRATQKDRYDSVQTAAFMGHISVLELLHSRGIALNSSSRRKKGKVLSPEALASSAGHSEVVTYIQKIEKTLISSMSENAKAAVIGGHAEILKQVLHRGLYNPEREAAERMQLAILAAKYGHIDCLRHLTDDGSVLKTSVDAPNLMLAAAANGHAKTVDFLVEHGLDVNSVKRNDSDLLPTRPLHLATRGGHVAVVRLLLGKRADLDARSSDHGTALQTAVLSGKADIVDALLDIEVDRIETELGVNHLHVAAKVGHVAVVKALLDRRADVNSQAGGALPTFHAVDGVNQSGHAAVLRLLIERRANIDFELSVGNSSGSQTNVSVTHIAFHRGDVHLLKVLTADWDVPHLEQLSDWLEEQHGEQSKLDYTRAINLDERRAQRKSELELNANPEYRKRMESFNNMYRSLAPHEQRALDMDIEARIHRQRLEERAKEL